MNGNLAYQDPVLEELIDGKVVAMSPPPTTNHIFISGNIYRIFSSFLKGKKCVAFPDGAGLYLTDKNHFRPDGMIVCDRSKIKYNGVQGAPDLVVEVLSPSTAKNDRTYKKDVYEQCGVSEYWIVDPVSKSIEIYLLHDNKYILDNVYSFYPDYLLESMTEEEKAKIVTEFKCHLYDDLIISLDDIFSDTF